MTRRAALGCLLALAAGPASAELRATAPEPAPAVVPGGPLRVDCFQYGAKIIERRALHDLAVSSERASNWLSFRQDDATLVITTMGSTTCIISPDRSGP